MTTLAVLLAACAAALAVAPAVAIPGANASGPGTGRSFLPVAPVLAAASAALLHGERLALALILLGVAVGGWLLWRQGRRERERELREAVVVELSEALVGDLRAGQPVLTALARGQELWPSLAPVVAAARLDADVPAALRRVAALPGAEGLGDVASAWQVSQRSGASLATALGQVAESARARQSALHVVRAELSSARATARLVAVLPFAVLTLTSGVGAEPWAFLLAHPAGLACLGVGAALVLGGLWWLERIAMGVTRVCR